MVCPKRISRYSQQNFVGSHLFYHSTGFYALTWIRVSRTGLLIGAKHTSRHLSENLPDKIKVTIGRQQVFLGMTFQKISRRLTKALSYVDIMPIGKIVMLSPIGRIAMNLICQF